MTGILKEKLQTGTPGHRETTTTGTPGAQGDI